VDPSLLNITDINKDGIVQFAGNCDWWRPDRAGDARNRGPAVRGVRAGRGRRPCRALSTADGLLLTLPRRGARLLLQVDRPDRDYREAGVSLQVLAGLRRDHAAYVTSLKPGDIPVFSSVRRSRWGHPRSSRAW